MSKDEIGKKTFANVKTIELGKKKDHGKKYNFMLKTYWWKYDVENVKSFVDRNSQHSSSRTEGSKEKPKQNSSFKMEQWLIDVNACKCVWSMNKPIARK